MKSFTSKNVTLLHILLCLFLVSAIMCCSGCAKEEKQESFSEAQAKADIEWVQGAKRPPSAETLLAVSRITVTQGKDEEAEFILCRITKEYPDCIEAYVELAELHMRRRQVGQAIKTLEKGLIQCPDNPILINDIGMCLFVRLDYKGAEEWFRQAAGIDPNNTRYRANVALSLGMQGRYEESLAVYKQILDEKDAHFNLSVICDARKDKVRADKERKIVADIEKKEAEQAAAMAAQEAKDKQ